MTQQMMTTTQKIATLLVSLGADRSAEILEYLEPNQAARIADEISTLKPVPSQTKRAILREFRALVNPETGSRVDINRAVATGMSRKNTAANSSVLCSVTAGQAADLLADEPVYLIALLLAAIPADHAAKILEKLPQELQSGVAMQLSTPSPCSAEMMLQLEQALVVKATRRQQEHQLAGQEMLAGAFHNPDDEQKPTVSQQTGWSFESLPGETTLPFLPPETAEGLTFAELPTLPITQLQAVLDQVTTQDISAALRGADPGLAEYILSLLPMSRRIAIKTLLKGSGAIPLRQILDAQQHLIRLAVECEKSHSLAQPAKERLHV